MMVKIVNLWRNVLLNGIHTPLIYGRGVGFPVGGVVVVLVFGATGDCLVSSGVACTPPAFDCCGPIDFKYAINCNNCSSFTSPWNVGIIEGCGYPATIFAL